MQRRRNVEAHVDSSKKGIHVPHVYLRISGPSVSCLLAGLGLAGRMGVICSVGVAHGSSDLAAVLGVSFL